MLCVTHSGPPAEEKTSPVALKHFLSTQNDAYGVLGGGVPHSIEVESNTAYSTVKAPSQSIAVDTNVAYETINKTDIKCDNSHEYF